MTWCPWAIYHPAGKSLHLQVKKGSRKIAHDCPWVSACEGYRQLLWSVKLTWSLIKVMRLHWAWNTVRIETRRERSFQLRPWDLFKSILVSENNWRWIFYWLWPSVSSWILKTAFGSLLVIMPVGQTVSYKAWCSVTWYLVQGSGSHDKKTI